MAQQGTKTGLPSSLEAAWGLDSHSTRGPKRGLTLEQVVAAGVKVAQSDGLAALSMSRVATELGSSPMSLYRYVTNKDELLTLMVDAACSFERKGAPDDETWRDGLTRCAVMYRDILSQHTWILRVPISAPPMLPNQLGWLEEALWSLRDTELAEQEKASVALLISGFVRNDATLLNDLRAAAAAPGSDTHGLIQNYGSMLEKLIDPVGYPALTAAVRSGAFDDDDEGLDHEFGFGLARILDGVEVMITARSAASRSGRAASSARRRPRG